MCAGCENEAEVVVRKPGEVAETVAVCLKCVPKVVSA